MSSNFVNSWQKHTPGNLEQTQMHREPHLVSCVRIQITSILSEQVFEVSSISSHTGAQPPTPHSPLPCWWHADAD